MVVHPSWRVITAFTVSLNYDFMWLKIAPKHASLCAKCACASGGRFRHVGNRKASGTAMARCNMGHRLSCFIATDFIDQFL